jgi:hypothetical protein
MFFADANKLEEFIVNLEEGCTKIERNVLICNPFSEDK